MGNKGFLWCGGQPCAIRHGLEFLAIRAAFAGIYLIPAYFILVRIYPEYANFLDFRKIIFLSPVLVHFFHWGLPALCRLCVFASVDIDAECLPNSEKICGTDLNQTISRHCRRERIKI